MGQTFMFVVIAIVMSVIHIQMWSILPKGFKEFLFASPILAFFADLLATELIVRFAGSSLFIGMCNLTAAVIFGVYVYLYREEHGIEGLHIKSIKLWKIPIGCYPCVKKRTISLK